MVTIPTIPTSKKQIPDQNIPCDPSFNGLRIVHFQNDPDVRALFESNTYEFQHKIGTHHVIPRVTMALKGAEPHYRLTATMHLTLKEFTSVVMYDPSQPPQEDYEALGMKAAHDQTQQDFKGAKKENLGNFKQYIVEAIRGDRVAYLPPVSGWQSHEAFDNTVFVALDESDPMVLYGILYLPKKPIMQSDGQTQTGALFQAAATGLAHKTGALSTFGTTLELELDVTSEMAGQSFADRNGRGSKKNKNLVANLDSSSGLAKLRILAIADTVFQGRLAVGTGSGTSETATKNIVDLSTIDQMLLNVISRGSRKAEQIKPYHVEHLLPFCKEFFQLLDNLFSGDWIDPTPVDAEPFRRLYVHGWPFALKAIAIAYHDARIDSIAPLSIPIGNPTKDEHDTAAVAAAAYLKATESIEPPVPEVPFVELVQRLESIDWTRYRKHWASITGVKANKDGSTKTRKIKIGGGSTSNIVETKAENTAATINQVANKILSNSWTDLMSTENAT